MAVDKKGLHQAGLSNVSDSPKNGGKGSIKGEGWELRADNMGVSSASGLNAGTFTLTDAAGPIHLQKRLKGGTRTVGEISSQHYDYQIDQLNGVIKDVKKAADDTFNEIKALVNGTVESAGKFREEVDELLTEKAPNADTKQFLDDVKGVIVKSAGDGATKSFFTPIGTFLAELPKKCKEEGKPMAGFNDCVSKAATQLAEKVTEAQKDLGKAAQSFVDANPKKVPKNFSNEVDAIFKAHILEKTSKLIVDVGNVFKQSFTPAIERTFKTASDNIATHSQKTVEGIRAEQHKQQGLMNKMVDDVATVARHAGFRQAVQEASSGLGEVAKGGQVAGPEAASNTPDLQQQQIAARRGSGQSR
ncbi:MAG: hypothetical protein ACTJLL_04900 [Anaplasma sp.]